MIKNNNKKMVTYKNNKNAQSLSTDLIVVMALVLFGVLFVVFNQINAQEQRSFEEIQSQSRLVSDSIYNSLLSRGIIEQNNVNLELLKQLTEEELREQLDINQDFAIAFERDGNLIFIDLDNGLSCLGSDKIIINDINCGFVE